MTEPNEDLPGAFQKLTRRLAEDPEAWSEVRGAQRQLFGSLAPNWENILQPDHLAPLDAALERVGSPRTVLDLGTGTGLAARLVAGRFPGSRVVALDLAEEMIREAVSHGGPVRYLVGDGSALPFQDAAFDLVTAANVFVFWDEIARVLTPNGVLAIQYSSGEETPIYLPLPEVKRHLSRTGTFEFADGRAGRGIWLLAIRTA